MLGTRAQREDPGESVRRGRRGGDDGADRWARRGSDGGGRAANGRARGLRQRGGLGWRVRHGPERAREGGKLTSGPGERRELGRGVRWARRGWESWACVGKGLGWGLGRFGLVSGCWAVFFLFLLFYF